MLSVVAAQIKTIQNGLNAGKKTVEMLGRDVALKTTIGLVLRNAAMPWLWGHKAAKYACFLVFSHVFDVFSMVFQCLQVTSSR